MAPKNPTPQEIIAGLVYFNGTELPNLRGDINSIGPSLNNSNNCLMRMHNVLSYLVRHCLQNMALAQMAARAQQEADVGLSAEEAKATQEAQNRALLAAAASAPAGTAVPIPSDMPGMTSFPIPQPLQASVAPPMLNVVVGRNNNAAPPGDPDPVDVPFVIIGQGGSRVIPPKGSTVAPKTFAPGQPIDLTFALTPAAGADEGKPEGTG